jgi:hypothetical protein
VAWNIVRHAFVIVFGNLKEALRASLVPFLILIGVLFVLMTTLGLPVYQDALVTPPIGQESSIALAGFISIPLYMFIFAWVAVTWHRYILLEEYPATVPAVANRPIGAYIGRTLMMTLQLVLVMIPVMLLVIPFIGNAGTLMLNTGSGLIFSIVIGSILSFFWLRIGVSLPAVAVGKPMSSREAWTETKPVWQTILGASVIMVALNLAVTLAFSLLFTGIPLISYVLSVAMQWVTMMVGVSVLTTIYGHVVEGRPLTGT